MAGNGLCQTHYLVGENMNQGQRQENGISSIQRRFMLLLGIVVSAELIVILVTLLAGNEVSGTELAASAVRVLLVALSGWFLLARDTSSEVTQAEPAPSIGTAQEVDTQQVWPNIDQLTHTSNQRGLTIHMMESMALAERYHHKLSVCFIRIAGLDGLSGDEGEEVLIRTSALLTELVRIPDKVGRYDDEQFMVIMPEADYAGASLVAGRLHASLDKAVSGKVSIHMGVAEFEHGDDLQRLLNRAQNALAKNL